MIWSNEPFQTIRNRFQSFPRHAVRSTILVIRWEVLSRKKDVCKQS
jgi:hypothetical protein